MKEHKELYQNQVSKVTLHFVLGHLSRKQAVVYVVGYRWNSRDELVLMVGPKPLLTEIGIHYKLESCESCSSYVLCRGPCLHPWILFGRNPRWQRTGYCRWDDATINKVHSLLNIAVFSSFEHIIQSHDAFGFADW